MNPQRRKQIESSLPRDSELIDDLKTAREALSLERQQRQYMMREMKRVTKYAFAGDNGEGTEASCWHRHIFDTEEQARSFGGRWKGQIVTVEIRPVAAVRVDGDVNFR